MKRTGSSPPGRGSQPTKDLHWWSWLAESVSTLKHRQPAPDPDFSHLDPSSSPGFYDAWKQAAQAPSHAPVDKSRWSLELIRTLDGPQLRQLSAAYFRLLGFSVEEATPSPGSSVDLRLFVEAHPRPGVLVQCRAWGSWNVGLADIRQLARRMGTEAVGEGIFVTTSSFTQEAAGYAATKGVNLIDGEDLLRKLLDLQVDAQLQLLALVTAAPASAP